MSTTFVEHERISHLAPLGLRFWDRVTAAPIWHGLQVSECSSGRRAMPTRSGVFVPRGIPALRAAETGAGDAAYWASPPTGPRLRIEVADELSRFHAVRIDATAPYRGVFAPQCGVPASPDGLPPGIPLFSLPSRLLPAGTAAVRAELTDAVTGAPAAWAVLEVRPADAPAVLGIADRQGRVVVPLPYPEPPWHGTSPPAGSVALSEQTWHVELAVRYSPAAPSPPEPRSGGAEPLDLCSVLEQAPAVLAAGSSPTVPVVADDLRFGRDLILNQGPRRMLLVFPAA